MIVIGSSNIIMDLQPIIGPWLLFQFPNQDSLGWGSARRKASAYTQDNTNTHNRTDSNVSSGIRSHNSDVWAGEDS